MSNIQHYICADWGSSNLRVTLVDNTGIVLDQRHLDQGILVCKGNFKATIQKLCHDWLQDFPNAPMYLCGMIGSREGWVDAGYLETPFNINHLAGKLVPVPGLNHPAKIVPGIKHRNAQDNSIDLMRGEETQILGAMRRHDVQSGIFILPGTHSKWADIESGQLIRFKTYMTGELYNILKENSILHYSIDESKPVLNDSFFCGIQRASEGDSLLSQIFTIRTSDIMEQRPSSEQSSYLSSILIGQEISHALTNFPDKPLYLIGASDLTSLYMQALNFLGRKAYSTSGDVASRLGLFSLISQDETLL